MEWNRSDTLALAHHQCAYCHGMGLLTGKRGGQSPCNCVFRGIFRACLDRFQHCASKEKYVSKVSWTLVTGRTGQRTWGRRDEEYMADFFLVSKRHLSAEEFSLFKFHFLYGADWKLCCRQLKMDRGSFFHAVYRIQQRLGRIFRELQPYALFPLDEYFASSDRRDHEMPLLPPEPPKSSNLRTLVRRGPRPLVPPLAPLLEPAAEGAGVQIPVGLPLAA
jgi:hypothetical protein